MKLNWVAKQLVALLLLLAASGGRSFSQENSLYVPLTVSEALPAGAQGVGRLSEPVTVGIPVPDRYGITSEGKLGMVGAAASQFRVLDRWPSGNVKWVLVDFLADVEANGQTSRYALTNGTGSSGGEPLARDAGQRILVDTGTMQVEIGKSRFDLFRRVVVAGRTVIDSVGSSGVVLVGSDGVAYTSKNDPSPVVVVEENGPVRSVIKIEGSHYSSEGAKLLDFTIRMHFYRGKSRIRVFYTLRNANRFQVINAGLRYLDLQVKTVIQNGRFLFPSHQDPVSGTLSGQDSVAIYQATSSFPIVADYGFVSPLESGGEGYIQEGYQVFKGPAVLASGGRDSYPELFYGRLADDGIAVVTGIRFAAGNWPKSIEYFADGRIGIGLWPKFDADGTYIRFGSHQTYEVLFEFAAHPELDGATATKRFQYPLVARAPVSWYNDSEALYEKIVSFSDEEAYYSSQGWPARRRRPEGLKIYRHKYWGEGGGTNQYDFTRINLINFIREDKVVGGEYFLMAEQRLQYNADQATYHSDNFDPVSRDVPELQGVWGNYLDWPIENENKVATEKVLFEFEHRHWYGMALYYYMAGDERFKDTVYDYGERLEAEARTGQNAWGRGLAWNIFGLTEMYRFTRNKRYLGLAKELFYREIYDSIAVPNVSSGFDWTRGYFVDGASVENKVRSIASFIHSAILYRALQLLYDELSYGDPAKGHLADVLTGISWFTFYELWFEYGATAGDFGYPYLYDLDNAPPFDVRMESGWYGGMREVFEVVAKGYELTGDRKFLARIEQTLQNAAYNVNGTYWYQDYPGLQQMLWVVMHSESLAVWRPLGIEATRNQDGSYSIVWTVPPGARRVEVKYSEKKLVEWLGFDRSSRTFEYDPMDYEAYFSAPRLTNIPPPSNPGTRQSIKVDQLPPDKEFTFMAKVLVGDDVVTRVDSGSGDSELPGSLKVSTNYPNPFNAETLFVFNLFRDDLVRATVYDITGREIITLLDKKMTAGNHLLRWNGSDASGALVSSGMYFLKVVAGYEVAVRKIVLLR